MVAAAGAVYIVDAMSSFGAIPIDLTAAHIDFLISSANKCIEGVPGFGFVLARRGPLDGRQRITRAPSASISTRNGPASSATANSASLRPRTCLLAFHQALLELEAEGAGCGRAARYRRNHEVLTRGMAQRGFIAYLAAEDQSYIITTYRYPTEPWFNFEEFYSSLSDLGFIIYPGKLSQEPASASALLDGSLRPI